MTRLLAAAVFLAAAGCSNAPLAGSLDGIWPAHGGPREKGGGSNDRTPVVPDIRPDAPRPPAGPAATDALPPPADIIPGAGRP